MQNNNILKKMSNKSIIASLIVLIITFILGLIFIKNIDFDFTATKTTVDELISNVDGNNPGAGEFMLISLLVGGGLTFLGEVGLLLMTAFCYLVIPVCTNGIISIINIVSRLFQIGIDKNWKNITTKVLLYIATILQGILSVYLLILSFTGFGLIYILIYLMLAINVYVFVKHILNLKSIKN